MRSKALILMIFALSGAPVMPQEEGDAPPPEAVESVAEDQPREKERARPAERPYIGAGGTILFFIEDSSLKSDPMPVLPAFYLNFSYPVFQLDPIVVYAALSLDLYSTHYLWDKDGGRALPAAVENRDALVFGFPTGIAAELRFNIIDALAFRLNAGLSADFRLTLLAEDLNEGIDPIEEITANKNNIEKYFWEDFHWLFCEFSAGFDIKLWKKFSLELAGRAFLPFNPPAARDGDDKMLGWRFGVGIRIIRKL
ncbi:MAG: hypothetical protein LBC77_04675 [Spirochaetaceae bacterium]|jgi:hypothetical protein|nr:hypothetical protein [Spirochaetaceae bacterium]